MKTMAWDAIVTALIIAGLVYLALVFVAHAHNHQRPELNEWYRNLHSYLGPCCDGEEAKHIATDQWSEWREELHCAHAEVDTSKDDAHGPYCVFLQGKWWNVPDDVVLKQPNLDGAALVWPYFRYNDPNGELISIRCFIPGAGT
jgi:hypothetical protein